MAQRPTEREAERSTEEGSGSAERGMTRGGAGTMQRQGQGGAISPGPFSLIDWMLDRLQRDFFGGALVGGGAVQALSQGGGTTRTPRLNINEKDNEYVITAEVPGVDPNDVQIEIEDDVLTLRAEAREVRSDDGGQVVSYTRFFTQFPLPEDIDVSSITASSKNGMVTLRLPKQEQSRNVRRIPVSAAGEGGTSQEQQRQEQQRAA